ncbi:MAG: hypothetical protein LBR38_02375 [Synergistaceae bacterium]|jgi:hypothetical protein|nr:hypothetical protein [Synergistaceae bacterium]
MTQNGKPSVSCMPRTKEPLTLPLLFDAAKAFCVAESKIGFPEMFGVTDGKAVGTFVEKRLTNYLLERFDFTCGNSASGIDLPDPCVNTDIKITEDVNIPGDEITRKLLADEIIANGVTQGYLTISNALQWRLQYKRVISLANGVKGVLNFDL